MSLDVAALMGGTPGVLSSSTPFEATSTAQGPESGARLGPSKALIGPSGADTVSDLSDSGGEDEMLREVR